MSFQVLNSMVNTLMDPFLVWPAWAVLALLVSTLHIGFLKDMFLSEFHWKRAPHRILWSLSLFFLTGFFIHAIDHSPNYITLGFAISAIAATNVVCHTIRFLVAIPRESKEHVSEGSARELSLVFSVMALVASYVCWPYLIGMHAENVYVEDAQTYQVLAEGHYQVTVVVHSIKASEDEKLLLTTSSGFFSVPYSMEYRMLMKHVRSVDASSDTEKASVITRDHLLTIRYMTIADGSSVVTNVARVL